MRKSSLSLFGQSIIEYSVIAGLLGLLCVPALALLAQSLNFSVTGMVTPAPIASKATEKGSINPEEEVFDQTLLESVTGKKPLDIHTVTINPDNLINAIQVSGALGDEDNVLASAALLNEFGNALESSDPELSNKVIELGRLGKEIAEAIRKCEGCAEGSPSKWYSGEQVELDEKINEFMNFWNDEVVKSSNYNALSDQDKLILSVLTYQTKTIGTNQTQIDYRARGTRGLDITEVVAKLQSGKTDADQVDENSDITIECGKNGNCNKGQAKKAMNANPSNKDG